MYQSPIEIIQNELQTEFEGAVMKAVQNVGIVVSKGELLQALAYDRSQYQLGFRDGRWRARADLVHCNNCINWETDWIPTCGGDEGWHYCSVFERSMKPEDYCSYAERKIDVEDN